MACATADDSTRMKLTGDPEVEGSDYINAWCQLMIQYTGNNVMILTWQLLQGYPDKQSAYIAAQGEIEAHAI